MEREHHEVAHLAPDAEPVAVADEVARQAFFADVGGNCGRVATLPGRCQRLGVEVGGEYLDIGPHAAPRRLLEQQDSDGVGLFASGTASDPHPNGAVVGASVEHRWDDLFGEHLKSVGVAKEAGHRDQQIVEQSLRLVAVIAKIGEVLLEGVGLRHLQASRDATHHGRPLVVREVLSRLYSQRGQDLGDEILAALFDCTNVNVCLGSDEFRELRRQLLQRQHEVGATGDCAARHGTVFGFSGVLHQDEAAPLADGAHAHGPVRTAAAEHDSETVSVLGGQ